MEKNKKCISCNNLLVGKQQKYCSKKCENFWRRTKNESRKKYNKEYRKKYYKEHRDEAIKNSLEYCKNNKEKVKIYLKAYNEENKEALKEKKKQYHASNKEIINKGRKKFREDNKEKIKKQRKQYSKNNKEKIRETNLKYYKKLRKNPIYRANRSISRGIYRSLLSMKLSKNRRHWEDLVSYTFQDLKEHLEGLFQPGMTWANYGTWHIDHKTPKSFFKFKSTNDTEFKYCWSLDNLQPLWAIDNLEKGRKLLRKSKGID